MSVRVSARAGSATTGFCAVSAMTGFVFAHTEIGQSRRPSAASSEKESTWPASLSSVTGTFTTQNRQHAVSNPRRVKGF
jgi:hypothetical protein